MQAQAKREKIKIVEVVQESHSAKETGQRPQFNYVLENLSKGRYNAIITWAPDRLSRNAGDLGKVVDLMDQGKLQLITTHSQSFSNNPNEKFLLMILGSQAKLENDNRGINVQRGHRSKCRSGIRPGPAPVGYLNILKWNKISSVEFDKDRAPIIREMFERVGNEGHSGRMIKEWLDSIDFKTPKGVNMPLSRIFAILKNSYYYGEFDFGGIRYKGSYEPLITKKLFDKVQIQLETVPKQWSQQVFPFKKICVCSRCGSGVTAEIRHRVLKSTKVNTHIYYHCCKSKDYYCREPYITEQEMVNQLLIHLPDLKLDKRFLNKNFKEEIRRIANLQSILEQQNKGVSVNTRYKDEFDITDQMTRTYLKHMLLFGTPEERLSIMEGVKTRFLLSNRALLIDN